MFRSSEEGEREKEKEKWNGREGKAIITGRRRRDVDRVLGAQRTGTLKGT